MTWDLSATLGGALSLALLGGVGLLVLIRAKRSWTTTMFGIWAMGWGIWDAVSLFSQETAWVGHPSRDWVLIAIMALIALLTVGLLVATPQHLGVARKDWHPLSPLWLLLPVASYALDLAVYGGGSTTMDWGWSLSLAVLTAGAVGAFVWYPSVARRATRPQQTSLAIMGLALAALPLFFLGNHLTFLARFAVLEIELRWLIHPLSSALIILIGAIRWATFRGATPQLRAGVVAATLAWVFLGQLASITSFLIGNTLYAAASAALVMYALFHGKAIRADLSFRWGISRGTWPGLAVASFFVVSEAAQEFFGDQSGNAYYGIAAAGLILLAMKPIQSVAERMAEQAVPGIPTVQPFAAPDDVFRRALRVAMLDGKLTLAEEEELARLQDALHMSAADATAIRHRVQAELAPA